MQYLHHNYKGISVYADWAHTAAADRIQFDAFGDVFVTQTIAEAHKLIDELGVGRTETGLVTFSDDTRYEGTAR